MFTVVGWWSNRSRMAPGSERAAKNLSTLGLERRRGAMSSLGSEISPKAIFSPGARIGGLHRSDRDWGRSVAHSPLDSALGGIRDNRQLQAAAHCEGPSGFATVGSRGFSTHWALSHYLSDGR